jgi:hypothetical protein
VRLVAWCLLACCLTGCGADAPVAARVEVGSAAACGGKASFRHPDAGMFGTQTIELDAATGDVAVSNTMFRDSDARVRLDAGTTLRIARALERLDWKNLAGAREVQETVIDDSNWNVEVCIDGRLAEFAGPASSCNLPSCNDLSTIVRMIEAAANFARLEQTFR